MAAQMPAHGGWSRTRARAFALLAAGTAGLGGLAMASTASAQPQPVKHIVVLYLENHTFDDLLGYWCNHNQGRCPDGGMPASVTLSNNSVVAPGVMPDIVPNVSHTVVSQQAAIDGGRMDGRQNVPGCAAKNRLRLHRRVHAGPGTQPRRAGAPIRHQRPDLLDGRQPVLGRKSPRFQGIAMDRLQAAGLSWRIYGDPTPPSGGGPTAAGYGWDICPSFAECLYTGQKANNVPSSTFVKDARSGKLPNFAIVTPGGNDAAFSEHNGFSITAGDDWLGQVASAVMNGPEWPSTVLFITWDDCGCFYDQVLPGVNPDGTAQGPCTPLVIVSPYAKPN